MEENIPKQSWWKRNWKWALPTGGCLLVIIVFAVMVGGAIWGVSNLLTESTPSTVALEKAMQNEEVTSLLGTPIETVGIPAGNVHYENGTQSASLSIPIKGPKGEGTIRVDGEGENDTWVYSTMKVLIEQEDSEIEINLLEENNLIKDF